MTHNVDILVSEQYWGGGAGPIKPCLVRIMASVFMGWMLNLDLRLQSLNSSKTLFNLRQTSSKLFPIQYIVVSSAYISTFPSVIASGRSFT